MNQEEPTTTKKGFNYYCGKCDEFYRWNKLKEAPSGMFNKMVCPECGEWVTDAKKNKWEK